MVNAYKDEEEKLMNYGHQGIRGQGTTLQDATVVEPCHGCSTLIERRQLARKL